MCVAQPEELDWPHYMLNFKIHKLENPDRYNVFAQIIDIDTRGTITAQKESTVEGQDDAARAETMTDAAAQIEADGVTIEENKRADQPVLLLHSSSSSAEMSHRWFSGASLYK